jgi:hypothetical protein
VLQCVPGTAARKSLGCISHSIYRRGGTLTVCGVGQGSLTSPGPSTNHLGPRVNSV